MNARSHRHAALSRLALAGAFLLTGLAGTARAAASIPLADAGGPGGSTQTGMLDETERSTNLIALTDGAPTAMLDEAERSTDLIALSPHDAPTTAIDTTAARRGQPF
jgi:hypothetical protein